MVAERLTDALAVLAEAGGEVAVVLADTRLGRRRPLPRPRGIGC